MHFLLSWLVESNQPLDKPFGHILLQLFTTVFSNIIYIPAIWISFQNKVYFETVLNAVTLAVSVFFHSAEVMQLRILGMAAEKWRRLDNIFTVASLNCLVFGLFLPTVNDAVQTRERKLVSVNSQRAQIHLRTVSSRLEFMRWGSFALNVICQENNSNNQIIMLLPFLVPSFLILYFYLLKDDLIPIFDKRWTAYGVCTIAVASMAYIASLDEVNDWMRVYHGCWHTFFGIATYCFSFCKVPTFEKEH